MKHGLMGSIYAVILHKWNILISIIFLFKARTHPWRLSMRSLFVPPMLRVMLTDPFIIFRHWNDFSYRKTYVHQIAWILL